MRENNGFYTFVQGLLTPIFRILFGMQVEGIEQFPEKGGVIVAVNHSSAYDPIILGLTAPRQLHFLAKAELFKNPILKKIIVNLNAIPLRRRESDIQAIRASFTVLKSKNPLLLFPEGTRSRDGTIKAARTGVGMLAWRNSVNIVPVYLSGTFQIFRNIWRKRIRVIFGTPIQIESYRDLHLSMKDIYFRIGEETMKAIKELRDGSQNRE